ncbi:MAG: peptidase M14, partial [Bacteroidia bacterium]|nr:peptidase M14 [Bacteroidia bacterium]
MNKGKALIELFLRHKQNDLQHRYITNSHIEPLLNNLPGTFKVDQIGSSVENRSIYSVKIGHGPKKVLMWSQMHGNESTTTKALFDMFQSISKGDLNSIIDNFQLLIIPILNPDGAFAYSRHNANDIDLNRDAINQSEPEMQALMRAYHDFKPDFCFNLHGQRTIFSAGNYKKPATLSFLAPAQDEACSLTETRKTAMSIIVAIQGVLQEFIPGQIGIYDDSFNLNCVGDTFQSHNVPTILFEAGHYENDYSREEVRKFMYIAILIALFKIEDFELIPGSFEDYTEIPQNQKLFNDIVLRDARLEENGDLFDIVFQYEEVLRNNFVQFIPIIEK